MSLDEDLRRAERADPSKAARLVARSSGAGYKHVTLDGRTLYLHQMTDSHLVNLIKMLIRRMCFSLLPSPHEHCTLTCGLWAWTNRELLEEAERRGLDPEQWYEYALRVFERTCDECGKRVGKWRGPTQRLQCNGCARSWELRCPACGTKGDRDRRDETSRCPKSGCSGWLSWLPKESGVVVRLLNERAKRNAKDGTHRQEARGGKGNTRCTLCGKRRPATFGPCPACRNWQ